ncbi:hypothetical protein LTR95_004475, partial [Oleoguttula sp. CCFEE 5521]
MPPFWPLLNRFLQYAAPYLTREDNAETLRPQVFAFASPTATTGSANRRRRRNLIRERCQNYLASNPVRRRVDSRGRIVRVGESSASGRPTGTRPIANANARRRPVPQPQPRGPVPVQAPHPAPAQPVSPAVRIPALVVRGREIIYECSREWWRARDNYTQLREQVDALELRAAGQEGPNVDDNVDLDNLRRQEEDARQLVHRLGNALALAEVRQEIREERLAAETGITLSVTGSKAASQIEQITQELFAEFESDDEEQGTGTAAPAPAPAPVTELSSRAASDADLDARMRAEIPIIARAFKAVWQHRDTYHARRLEHEAGRDPGLPGWTPDWLREIFDREHLREGMLLTRYARELHEVWITNLAIARDRGLGPFMDEQHIMFPAFNGGYTQSEVQRAIATAPRGRIMKWTKDLLQQQDNPYRAVPEKKEDYQYGLDDALDPEPGESASLCYDGGDRLDDVAARNRGGPFPRWSKN